MNFNVGEISQSYRAAVEAFEWPEQLSEEKIISESDFTSVISQLSQKIIEVSSYQRLLAPMAESELSLLETCYLLVQSEDVKYDGTADKKIQQATAEEKTVLGQTFDKLHAKFAQVESNELKGAILLYGIHRIHELVKGVIVANLQQKN